MESTSDEMKKSGSRFQVARVETTEDQARDIVNKEQNGDINTKKPSPIDLRKNEPETPNSMPDERRMSNAPESPSATFSVGGDSIRSGSTEGYNYVKSHCVMNTIEALPCVDHYRNIFSATAAGNLKARPTLAELHEERVRELLYFKRKVRTKCL